MFGFVSEYVGISIMLLAGLFALTKGGRPERIGAGTMLVAWFLSILAQMMVGYEAMQWPVFIIDIIVLGVFVALVWKSPRSWPVWASALQLLAVASHVMVFLKMQPTISAFYTVVNMTGYGIMLAITIGAVLAWQERRAVGEEAE
ncbi:hypothetical protein ABC365_04665 [Brevundimonas sp. 3P9-tot-E]|jgi:hypothetical protein|uniref:hypothetical protein n=1 Tax=Brevundimonas TaxID=41275 RepID=UPI000F7B1756|nr:MULTISPECIES: hypothetical protein [Brevundimonas]MDA0742374.1 hypothetical protein [Pseudomonadota bacterium]MBK1969471.1 hypothetical protein [Brevundimonas diminuta]MBK1975252.1 hypothetical protein [Brevundimonas diminuta]MDA1321093.1 hypothetical protein [Pseudomonadota bacterium]MDM8352137.1 hypothetical protein [Brevundimonas diminuta]